MAEDLTAVGRFIPPSQMPVRIRSLPRQLVKPSIEHSREPHFDEGAYLAAFPDVSLAVEAGAYNSALAHYLRHGASELRLMGSDYQATLGRLQTSYFPAHNVDHVIVTSNGYILVEGWLDDEADPLDVIRVYDGKEMLAFTFKASRMRRIDVEERASIEPGRRVGFWALLLCSSRRVQVGKLTVSISAGPYCRSIVVEAAVHSLDSVRNRIFAVMRDARSSGASAPEVASHLDGQAGALLGDIGIARSVRLVAGASCTRFRRRDDPGGGEIRTSLMIRLDEGPQAVFLQASLQARASRRSRPELIFVLDNPALLEHVLREAASSADIYDLSITVVAVASRLGFGAAMDAAATYSTGQRLIALDHAVLPQGPAWLDHHDEIIQTRPFEETSIIGAMQGEGASRPISELKIEEGIAAEWSRTRTIRLVDFAVSPRWVTHPHRAVTCRSVEILSGHVVSLERSTLKRLGGFGHLFWSREASVANLCFRAREIGIAAWEHRLQLNHLPAGGSKPGYHDSALLLDRCLFSSRWPDSITRRDRDPVFTRRSDATKATFIDQQAGLARSATAES
jgi:hypothetical protein